MRPCAKIACQWACGAVGSALPWHGRGRRFEPDQVHHIFNNLADPPHRTWPEIGRKFQKLFSVSGFSLSSALLRQLPHLLPVILRIDRLSESTPGCLHARHRSWPSLPIPRVCCPIEDCSGRFVVALGKAEGRFSQYRQEPSLPPAGFARGHFSSESGSEARNRFRVDCSSGIRRTSRCCREERGDWRC